MTAAIDCTAMHDSAEVCLGVPGSAEVCADSTEYSQICPPLEPTEQAVNRLFYGDNLDVLRKRKIHDESVDLIYLDPPFNSQRIYNILFKEKSGAEAQSQQQAFLDAWEWPQAVDTYTELTGEGGRIADILRAFHALFGPGDFLAYLSMMAARLNALYRVLKPTGSLYLHCDPTAGHYLKMLLDAVFGFENFRNEIIWKRTSAHSGAKRYGPVHDVILFYSKSEKYTWNERYGPYDQGYIEAFFTHVDEKGRRWTRTDLTGPGVRHGDSGLPWGEYNPTDRGRHWQPPSYFYDKYKAVTGTDLAQYPLIERLGKLDEAGLIHWPKKKAGMP